MPWLSRETPIHEIFDNNTFTVTDHDTPPVHIRSISQPNPTKPQTHHQPTDSDPIPQKEILVVGEEGKQREPDTPRHATFHA